MGALKGIRNVKILFGREPPREVMFAVTNACNISCRTCAFGKVPRSEQRFVATNVLGPVLDHLREGGVRMVSITGGEPLLHPEFLRICQEIDERGMMISYIATNGTLLDEAVAHGLSGLNVNIVGLSVDPVDGDGWGITRGLDIERTIPRAKRLLDDHGIECYAGVVLGRHTRDVHALMGKIRSWGFTRVIFSYPQVAMASSYRAAEDCEFTNISLENAHDLVDAIEAEKRTNPTVSIFNTRVNLEEFLRAQSGGARLFDCTGGTDQFYLDWNYDLFRCFNDGARLGNMVELARSTTPLEFQPHRCQGCTQQAFLDYASFYHAFGVVRDGVDSIKSLEVGRALGLLRNERNRLAVRSLLEAYLGGFV